VAKHLFFCQVNTNSGYHIPTVPTGEDLWERLRSIVMSTFVCICLSVRIFSVCISWYSLSRYPDLSVNFMAAKKSRYLKV